MRSRTAFDLLTMVQAGWTVNHHSPIDLDFVFFARAEGVEFCWRGINARALGGIISQSECDMSLSLIRFQSGPWIAISALVGLGGCATVTEIYDANGQPALMISCDGSAVPMSTCYNRALKECPTGYQLLGSENRNQGFIAGPYAASSVNTKSIAVRCNG